MIGRKRLLHLGVCALTLSMLSVGTPTLDAQGAGDVQKAVDAAYGEFRTLQEGKNADRAKG